MFSPLNYNYEEARRGAIESLSLEREKCRTRNITLENFSSDSEHDELEKMIIHHSNPFDVQEVWFAGCHCDVGGGSISNFNANSLARISLRWMVRECIRANTGILFEENRLRVLVLDSSLVSLSPTTLPQTFLAEEHVLDLGEEVQAPKGSSVVPEMETRDAYSPIHDQLELSRRWWPFEYLPIRRCVQRKDGTYEKKWIINRGRPRLVRQDELLYLHFSIKKRIESDDLKYIPRVLLTREPVWVD
ncbi:hypothetical protein EW145_g3192 [Phellinidium pouzarii]|uniref:T6SS Phospholipase effector Tle1-like catalytic domain-containing protein n=1 Tax=Phellinidium pouzarii TaxID=167371 RepID=A0A4V3XCY8_9AGAM|nr:hypothetical protein EW145_g3192 [Phellinidium pouzarii]